MQYKLRIEMNNPSLIKSFSVYGLFGTHDVHIPFDENIKILIGENGLGKTQVLNIFYYTLCRKFERLIEYPFDKITLKFSDNIEISINKDEIEQTFFKHPVAIELINKIGIQNFIDLKEFSKKKNISSMEIRSSSFFRKIMDDLPFSPSTVLDVLRRASDENDDLFSANIKIWEQEITNRLNGIEIMYFPTYRRVEEDLKNLGYDEEQFHTQDNKLIHFGMNDVRKRFNEIENTIDKLLKEGFSKISSEILSQLVKGFSGYDKSILSRIDEKDIEIILARVGNQLTEPEKEIIKNIVANKTTITDQSLSYLLQILIEIYEKQKPLDKFVKVYRDICNKYLIDKKVFYDESAIKIFVKSEITEKEIPLNKLSSGEKQIISIFSKLYLADENQRFVVLFDEPELSLSMIWQRQLLPDIFSSKKCDFLLAVTHSPFIFDNELDQYAIGLSEYIKPSKNIVG
jgi:predicted ATP-binding protein involved in virulence